MDRQWAELLNSSGHLQLLQKSLRFESSKDFACL
jgi:hypothetical protein